MNLNCLNHELRLVYRAAVEAVKPSTLINKTVRYSDEDRVLHVGDSIEVPVNQNFHVVGFGKAVLGMALQLDEIVGSHIKKGIISIPHAVRTNHNPGQDFLRKFQIYEGARNNIPDEESLLATNQIKQMVSGLVQNDVLFILISGGGSALLSSPIDGLSLEEKRKTIQLLSKSGADIKELNTVRKRLSSVKGGKLGLLCRPATTITLILSDVIGDPLDIIASGPTVEAADSNDQAWAIIKKYRLDDLVPSSVAQILNGTKGTTSSSAPLDHVRNVLIGNNSTALEAAESWAGQQGFTTSILSDRISGEARAMGHNFARLAWLVEEMIADPREHKFMEDLSLVLESLGVDPSKACRLEKLVRGCERNRKNLCLLAGGETTVTVTGKGLGGRNQEMALAWAVEMDQLTPQGHQRLMDVAFLSAGTDGIDGPTNAAGAIGHPDLVREASAQGLSARSFLVDNDSFNFFKKLSQGRHHVLIGQTGTNVMDIQILCFNWLDKVPNK